MIIEDTNWYQYNDDIPLVYLRSDYGYYWDGDVTIRNTDAYLYDITDAEPIFYLVHHKYANWYFGYTCAFPSLDVDNLDVYSIKNQAPVESGYEIYLFNYLETAEKMHLAGDSGVRAIFDYKDSDGDGFIDEPLYDVNLDGKIDEKDLIDIDGNGVAGNTSLSYNDPTTWYGYKEGYDTNRGATHPTCKENLNIIKPPKYIKITNNDGVDTGGYTFIIPNTYGKGISDGGWHRYVGTPDTMGGFFGNTRFIYGEGDGEFFYGTNHLSQTKTATFKFQNYS